MSRRSLVAVLSAAAIVIACTRVPRAQSGRVSPHETTTAVVAGADLSIVYGRPSMRGRRIFGSLVPFGIVWCPGADEGTMLSTSRPLRLGDLTVPAGEYSLWMLPTEEAWTLIVNSEAHVFHTNYRARADFGRVALQKRVLASPVEQLTFSIESTGGSDGRIVMSWADTEVSAAFRVQ